MILRYLIQLPSHWKDTQNKGSASMNLKAWVYKMGMQRHKII